MIKVGVIGCTGYSGQELVDILADHPDVELTCLTARFEEETKYSDAYPRFAGRVDLVCDQLDIDKVAAKCDLVFLALPHKVSMEVAPGFLKHGKKVIDLSGDYRLTPEVYERWYGKGHTDIANLTNAVYGLPEINRDLIKKAQLIANPGCYPTSVILALLPLAKELAASGSDIIVDSKSGSTGAGRKASVPLSFSEVDEDLKCYKANEHQHMPEMEKILSEAAASEIKVNFAPHLLSIKRGILSTIYVKHQHLPKEEDIYALFDEKYKNEPFVRLRKLGDLPRIADVSLTNYCDIGLTVKGGMLVIVSVIDNLLKGASGQAVQNMNLIAGINETTGLK